MKKTTFISVLLILFLFLSFHFISPFVNSQQPQYRSSDLKQITTKEECFERTDYVDSSGKLTVAADTGYATMIRTNTSEGVMEKYYDEKGNAVSKNAGYYGVLLEFDETGNNIQKEFLDQDNKPCLTKDGYAIEKRIFNEDNQIVVIRYYDIDGKPIQTLSSGFGKINNYDEHGLNFKTTFIDNIGHPMITGMGYAIVVRQFYLDEGADKGRVKKEFYFDDKEEPVSLSLGQYGLYKEYNEFGQGILLTYLDSDGNPIVTTKGYTTIKRSFKVDNNVATEQYYDINGNPYSLVEGQYGVRSENGQTIYLKKDGTDQFNLKKMLYNSSWVIIPFAIILIFISSLISQKLNVVLIIPYILVIVYLTLLYRDNIGEKGISLLKNYGNFFVDSETRASIIKNIWLFVPLGTFLYRLVPKKNILLIAVTLSALIECIQFFSHTGFCELDDVISNSLGAYIGFSIGKLTSEIKKRINNGKQIHSL